METISENRRAILFVDDEPNLLAALRRTMHTLGTDYSVVFAACAEEAISLSAQHSFDIVISDMRMPGMDGAELLHHIRRNHPETIRIVLSGQATLDSTVRALAATHQYLAKPYSFLKLKDLIMNLTESQSLIACGTIRKHISQISALPCQRKVLERFRAGVLMKEINRSDLLTIIKQDLGLMATIIHAALSMNPQAAEKITGIDSALAMLSIDSLRALIESPTAFLEAKESYHGVVLSELAEHSLKVAAIAQKLSADDPSQYHRLADLSGLLHDVGKLVMAQCFGELCFTPESEQKRSEADVLLQRDLLGVSHAEAGAYLLTLWGMPKELIEAVRDHHSVFPVLGATLGLAELIFVANKSARQEVTFNGKELGLS